MPDTAQEGALAYAVKKTDARFRSLQIELSGSGIAGRLDAFARLPRRRNPAWPRYPPRVTGQPFCRTEIARSSAARAASAK